MSTVQMHCASTLNWAQEAASRGPLALGVFLMVLVPSELWDWLWVPYRQNKNHGVSMCFRCFYMFPHQFKSFHFSWTLSHGYQVRVLGLLTSYLKIICGSNMFGTWLPPPGWCSELWLSAIAWTVSSWQVGTKRNKSIDYWNVTAS